MQIAATAGIENMVARLRERDVRAIARAISLIEDDTQEASRLLSACFPHTGRALQIGVTGSPGAGKSSLVDRLCRHYLHPSNSVGTAQQRSSVGVLAVDPTSPYTGGALLGDRIRMQEHHANADFYLRSMATRGALGGLAHKTAEAASILDAAGFDRIFIETVGVGQDEVDIVRLADITIVVLVPGMGDDVQSIKAGIMEIADIFVVNKSDRDGADRVEAEVLAMQSHTGISSGWTPPVVKTNSLTSAGVAELAAAIDGFHRWLLQEDRLLLRRRSQWKQRLFAMVQEQLMRAALLNGLNHERLEQYAAAIVDRTRDPFETASMLVDRLVKRTD
jgi:LAO/AO transport system kinase